MRILITGGGGAASEALDRLWADRYDVHFADADPAAIPPTVRPERRHAVPSAGPQWAEAVADTCRRLSIDVLIPAVDEELPFVPDVIARAPGVTPLIPTASFVTLMRDKLDSMNALATAGLVAPRTTTIDLSLIHI